MRLGQLARKLSVRPSQIVDLLAKKEHYFEDGSNAKLSDELVKQIVLNFAPERLAEIMTVQTQEVEPEPQPEPETIVAEVVVEKLDTQPEIVAETSPELLTESETIRAPKVELTGLKVLGKIELPQPRKKEEVKEGEAEAKPKQERREKRRPVERREQQDRNPIAQQREAEAREKEERRKKVLEEEKERKRINYLNKIKTTQTVKSARIFDEADEAQVELKPEQKPRTWVGRFLKWLNT